MLKFSTWTPKNVPGEALYIRQARVIVGKQAAAISASTSIPQSATEFSVRTTFSVSKTDGSFPNSARITLWNLRRQSRVALEDEGNLAWLQVGYRPVFDTVFFGSIKKLTVNQRGPDILADIECGDAEVQIQNSVVSIGLGANATNRQVLEAIVGQLKLQTFSKEPLPLDTYKHGFTESRLASKLLDEIMAKQGFTWSIQDGELHYGRRGVAYDSVAVDLSPETGLLGVPTKSAGVISGRSLLISRIRPGRIVNLSWSDAKNVLLRVSRVDFTGDSSEGVFESRFEGVPIAN